MAVPIKPIKTPQNWLRLKFNPKITEPKIMVFKGVSEFKMEQIELLTLVSAIAKRYAGIKVPNIDVKAMYFH